MNVERIYGINVIIKDEKEYAYFENSLIEIGIAPNKIKFFPFYNKKNRDFFEKYVFLSTEEILQNIKVIQQIHQNSLLNKYFFGKLTIMADGNIYTDINGSSIGNIDNITLLEAVYKALALKKSSWMKIRVNGKCGKCLFQFLCPPISNYEYALGKYGICKKTKWNTNDY